MARFLPKTYTTQLVKRTILWGLLIFYSIFIILYYGRNILQSMEGFDVSDNTSGNIISLDTEYASTMPSVKLNDIYSYTAEPIAITSGMQGNSNSYGGPSGYIGGSTLTSSNVTVNQGSSSA